MLSTNYSFWYTPSETDAERKARLKKAEEDRKAREELEKAEWRDWSTWR